MTDFKHRYFAIILTTLLFALSSSAQRQQDRIKSFNPLKVKAFAKDAVKHGGIYSAIDFYEHYLNLYPDKVNIKYELAELYRQSRDYKKAELFYKQVYEVNPDKYPLSSFYFAQMMKMNGKYEDAKNQFEVFKKELKKIKDGNDYKKILMNEINGCDSAQLFIDNPLKMLITRLNNSINKAYIDYSPVPIDKTTILYASLDADSIIYYSPEDTSYRIPRRKFYKATKTPGPQDDWKRVGEADFPVNHEDYDVGNGCLSPDGLSFYFTRTQKIPRKGYISNLWAIYKEDNNWSEPVMLPDPINVEGFSTSHPAIGVTSDTKLPVLYFTSNRPGGMGGMDIWYATWNAKKKMFVKPRAIKTVNSPLDEFSPFYDIETHQLYFSSQGRAGMGGFDIYKATGEAGYFSYPENAGYPVNSSADDLYFVISKDREKGFFVSNREGGAALKNPTCCDDIYTFRWTEYIHIAIEGYIYEMVDKNRDTSKILGNVLYDSSTSVDLSSFKDSSQIDSAENAQAVKDSIENLPVEKIESIIQEASVSLYLVKNNESFFIRSLPSDFEGEYFYDLEQGNDYKIMVEKDGYFNNQIYFTTQDIVLSDTLFRPIELKPIPTEPIVINNIYYEFDKSNLTADAKITIDTTLMNILSENPDLIVEISSHTDSKGDDNYNQKLSQDRAESVVKYLVEKGIEKKRLIPKGYGESKPIAPNENSDGTDNPDGRQMNRRTEFRVIGSSNQFSKLNQNQMIIKRNPKNTFQQEQDNLEED